MLRKQLNGVVSLAIMKQFSEMSWKNQSKAKYVQHVAVVMLANMDPGKDKKATGVICPFKVFQGPS